MKLQQAPRIHIQSDLRGLMMHKICPKSPFFHPFNNERGDGVLQGHMTERVIVPLVAGLQDSPGQRVPAPCPCVSRRARDTTVSARPARTRCTQPGAVVKACVVLRRGAFGTPLGRTRLCGHTPWSEPVSRSTLTENFACFRREM